jgi:hypothetical protein
MVRRCHRVALLAAVSIAITAPACTPKEGGRCTMGQATCIDGKSGLFCGPGGTYQALSCGGDVGCRREGAKVSCDQSIAAAGDTCAGSGFACTVDMENALSCQRGKFVVAEICSGPGGCKVAPFDGTAPEGAGSITCDNDVARAGDPCRVDGDYACTADKTAALRCTRKKMILVRSCLGPNKCSVSHPKPQESEVDCNDADDVDDR